jgi:hypothetical protein
MTKPLITAAVLHELRNTAKLQVDSSILLTLLEIIDKQREALKQVQSISVGFPCKQCGISNGPFEMIFPDVEEALALIADSVCACHEASISDCPVHHVLQNGPSDEDTPMSDKITQIQADIDNNTLINPQVALNRAIEAMSPRYKALCRIYEASVALIEAAQIRIEDGEDKERLETLRVAIRELREA